MRDVYPDRIHAAHSFPWVLFGLTVVGVLQNIPLTTCERDLDVAELFCGVGAIWQAGQAAGYNAVGFDKSRVPGITDAIADASTCEDILSPAGFMNAVKLVIRLKQRGLLWLAPMCSSFCWLSLSVMKRRRNNNYMGDELVPAVVEGTLAAKASAFLMTLAYVRGVDSVLENPVDSSMFPMFRLAGALTFCTTRVCCMRCPFAVEPDGQRHWKRYVFLSYCAWVNRLRRKCSCPSKQHIKLTKKVLGVVTGIKKKSACVSSLPSSSGQRHHFCMGGRHHM